MNKVVVVVAVVVELTSTLKLRFLCRLGTILQHDEGCFSFQVFRVPSIIQNSVFVFCALESGLLRIRWEGDGAVNLLQP